jgi:hypothetical protein
MSDFAYLTEIKYWLDNYAAAGVPDKHAVEVYLDCEPDERVRPFRLQLQSVSDGKIMEETLDKVVGKGRKGKHGSYERWAQLMTLWIHVPKN